MCIPERNRPAIDLLTDLSPHQQKFHMPSGSQGVDRVHGQRHAGTRDALSFVPDPHSVVVDKGVVRTHSMSGDPLALVE
jgi:hypothetical protein